MPSITGTMRLFRNNGLDRGWVPEKIIVLQETRAVLGPRGCDARGGLRVVLRRLHEVLTVIAKRTLLYLCALM